MAPRDLVQELEARGHDLVGLFVALLLHEGREAREVGEHHGRSPALGLAGFGVGLGHGALRSSWRVLYTRLGLVRARPPDRYP